MNIGQYEIEWINEDELKITRHSTYSKTSRIICGGDLETILETVFIRKRIA